MNFTQTEFATASLKGQINSSHAHDYQYEDYSVAAGQAYYYKLADVDLKGQRTFRGPIKVQVTQGDLNAAVSTSVIKNFRLYPNQPNPFNPSTTITFDVPQLEQGEANLSINIFDIQGQKVRTLFSGALTGNAQYRLQWDGVSDAGQPLPAGIYFVVLRARDVQQSIKVCMVK
ncbi:hypothetical protein Calab_0544 [Caldithrix abyssi DSM 13497]|uniref:Por secretion system C-terminal sorting domain-containing protein n=1 Tax=Caldithrix abyssi DSM 13497 TaxID=880073 RepID=H1XRN5_CALAY|nr:FlgD immunoglobulin-like domain containing protein [Caldithrix abyssi]APF20125.1 Por secretion system C-terminal sorting domain-containing protein [Caldithrix abyssi DSM 13497]EHO40188.1 hypothetical protein Calab_0544 [Caldithrix abyssi DSM 13497]